MCGFVHGNILKATIIVIYKKQIGMCLLEIHMGMEHHVLI